MKFRTFTFILLFCLPVFIHAQVIWDGGGDAKLWNDALNWSTDAVPVAGEIVEIGTSATISGTAPATYGQLRIVGNATVVLALNLSIDGTAGDFHAVTVGKTCTLSIGDGVNAYQFNVNTNDTKGGIANFGSGDSSMITIASMANLRLMGGSNGINAAAPVTQIVNKGTITIDPAVKIGIKSVSTFDNQGSIISGAVATDAIQVAGGVFTNEGTITINSTLDDGIEILTGGVFNNEGSINITVAETANASRNGIAVGTLDAEGSFNNMANGTINIDGGSSATARSIMAYEKGSFTNEGLVTVKNGNPGATIYTRNSLQNLKGGVIDLTNGRINVNVGTLVNNGLIKSSRQGSSVFTSEGTIIVNNAFYQSDSAFTFATGAGTITNNGIYVDSTGVAIVDAASMCEVDLGEVSYDYFYEGNAYATSTSEGNLAFMAKSVLSDTVELTTTIPGITIQVLNVCPEAIINTASKTLVADHLNIYPTVAGSGDVINIDGAPTDAVIRMYDLNGAIIGQGRGNRIEVPTRNPGMILLSVMDGKVGYVQKLIIR
ncbi:MAG: hypothetical protein KDC49_04690 [Saprospiraceae bacterium]|nr:hypothetical protein [Saprospiraceae bacterium]